MFCHKPRVYRSTEGCCICRAKSSSSRFTDSRKYETDSMKCFDLKYPRHGEICNACVLLVKRYKRLPQGSNRHWGHVVDARAGPGTKSLSKYKKYKDSNDSGDNGGQSPPSSSQSAVRHSNSASNGHTSNGGSKSSLVAEKFSKIFKKNKKNKASTTAHPSSSASKKDKQKRSITTSNGQSAQNWEQNKHSSMLNIVDSYDSDYDNGANESGNGPGGRYQTPVEFQTQTRSSSYKSRQMSGSSNCSGNLGGVRNKRPMKATNSIERKTVVGCRKRKMFKPMRNHRNGLLHATTSFIDENEWEERKSCCGMIYQCSSAMGNGAILMDIEFYRPCSEHSKNKKFKVIDQKNSKLATVVVSSPTKIEQKSPLKQHQKPQVEIKPVIAAKSVTSTSTSMPAPTLPPVASLPATSNVMVNPQAKMLISPTSTPSMMVVNTTMPTPAPMPTPTPVLKKHHLFYKRQSESFPHGDMININNSNNNSNNSNHVMTAISQQQLPQSQHTKIVQVQQASTSLPSSVASTPSMITVKMPQPPVQQQQPSIVQTTLMPNVIGGLPTSSSVSSHASLMVSSNSCISIAPSTTASAYMPRHSTAKIATITPTINLSNSNTSTTTTMTPIGRGGTHSFIHKIKAADANKIIKPTLNMGIVGGTPMNGGVNASTSGATTTTTLRLKSGDISEMKHHVIKTMDKSYVLTTTTAKQVVGGGAVAGSGTANANNLVTHQIYQYPVQPISNNSSSTITTTTNPSSAGSSPSSVTSSSSTKYSDNSSDSGFDENMQDRKSASPMQEDTEKKLLTRAGVQTMFLASGVQIQGQHQNLVLTGNEVAAKILQNRKSTASVAANSGAGSTMVAGQKNMLARPQMMTTTTAVKIAQIVNAPQSNAQANGAAVSSNQSNQTTTTTTTIIGANNLSHAMKMRAIYNNNTIQHENGVTTIVPASSLAASSQTAAMNAIAPSTVTITPAPTHINATPGNGLLQHNNKKFSSNNLSITSSQNNNYSNPTNTLTGNQHHHGGGGVGNIQTTHFSTINTSNVVTPTSLNQKIILVKSAPGTKYGSAAAAAGGGIGGGLTTSSSLGLSGASIIPVVNHQQHHHQQQQQQQSIGVGGGGGTHIISAASGNAAAVSVNRNSNVCKN